MKMTTVTCLHCGRVVERPQKEVKRSLKLGRRLFCSNSCQGKHKDQGITKQCLVCGADFYSKTYEGQKYCSRACANALPRALSKTGLEIREAVENAVADLRLEGLAPTPDARLLFEQFVQGDLTEEQLVNAILAR